MPPDPGVIAHLLSYMSVETGNTFLSLSIFFSSILFSYEPGLFSTSLYIEPTYTYVVPLRLIKKNPQLSLKQLEIDKSNKKESNKKSNKNKKSKHCWFKIIMLKNKLMKLACTKIMVPLTEYFVAHPLRPFETCSETITAVRPFL